MKTSKIFVNLKRFDIPKTMGGVAPIENPLDYITGIINECINLGLGSVDGLELTLLLPESLILTAQEVIRRFPIDLTKSIAIGCQGVYRDDVAKGHNFGAFTSNRPAAAMNASGCTWSIIGHSEERKDKFEILSLYDGEINCNNEKMKKAKSVVNSIMFRELKCALNRGMKVLLCIGESLEERGNGTPLEQRKSVEVVLKNQLKDCLTGCEDDIRDNRIVIGYEPIWAIGPGKTPPNTDYIEYVVNTIKKITRQLFNKEIDVVYGGGLKEENASGISSIQNIDGGLIALTNFSGEIGFYPSGLKKIIDKYLENQR